MFISIIGSMRIIKMFLFFIRVKLIAIIINIKGSVFRTTRLIVAARGTFLICGYTLSEMVVLYLSLLFPM